MWNVSDILISMIFQIRQMHFCNLLLQDDSGVTQLHSSFDGEGIALPSALGAADAALFASAGINHGLANMALTSLAPATLPGVSPQTINSIASSIQSLTGGAVSSMPGTVTVVAPERSGSRNSNCSPAMSDSGIIVDAGTNGASSQNAVVTFSALQRLGSVNANSSGQSCHKGKIKIIYYSPAVIEYISKYCCLS